MTRCFSTLGCAEFSLEAVFALATKHRIPAVEVRALGGGVDLPRYLAENFGPPAALAARVRAQPVRIVALDTSLHLAGADAEVAERERAALLAFLPWAEALGVKWLRVFDGKGASAATAAEAIAQAAATVGWWREQRRVHGWQADLMVETHDTLFTAAAIGRFLAAAPDTAILWDSHHTWRKGGEDPLQTWPAIRASVVHVHVKDSIPVPSARHPFTYTLPGDGGFPIAPLLGALRADGFGGAVSLEWERLWHPYLPSLDEALTVAAQRGWW
jgi:sugar phosphate isomerase/epimerase